MTAAAPYITALPSKIGASPVYAEEHREPIEIWRGSLRDTSEHLAAPIEFHSRLDLTTYVEALNAMKPEDIDRIRQGNKGWSRFRAALRNITDRDADRKELEAAYLEHRQEVELFLVERLGLQAAKRDNPVKLETKRLGAGKDGLMWLALTATETILGVPALSMLEMAVKLVSKTLGLDATSRAEQVTTDQMREAQAAVETAKIHLGTQAIRVEQIVSDSRLLGHDDHDTFIATR